MEPGATMHTQSSRIIDTPINEIHTPMSMRIQGEAVSSQRPQFGEVKCLGTLSCCSFDYRNTKYSTKNIYKYVMAYNNYLVFTNPIYSACEIAH